MMENARRTLPAPCRESRPAQILGDPAREERGQGLAHPETPKTGARNRTAAENTSRCRAVEELCPTASKEARKRPQTASRTASEGPLRARNRPRRLPTRLHPVRLPPQWCAYLCDGAFTSADHVTFVENNFDNNSLVQDTSSSIEYQVIDSNTQLPQKAETVCCIPQISIPVRCSLPIPLDSFGYGAVADVDTQPRNHMAEKKTAEYGDEQMIA